MLTFIFSTLSRVVNNTPGLAIKLRRESKIEDNSIEV